MQLFPDNPEIRQCPVCQRWFKPGNINCGVLHSPGDCCHYGDEGVPAPEA